MNTQSSVQKMFRKLSSVLGESTSILGVDLGSASIKIVQVRKGKGRPILETYGELSTGAYQSLEDGRAVALQLEQVSAMVKDLLKESEASATSAYVSIPLRYSFVTLVEFPHMSGAELRSAIPFEARKYIPLPLDTVRLEWWPANVSEEEQKKLNGKIPVLLAASQKEMIDQYKQSVERAGIEMRGSEIEVFSGTRSVISQFRTPVMVVDIGASTTKITIADYGSIRAAYGIEKGAQSLTLTLSQALGIDFERAEEMKREVGIVNRPETAEIRKTIMPFVDYLLDESDRLRGFYKKKSGRNVDKIIFIGGGAKLPGLVEYATEHFGVEVILGNPFSALACPEFMQSTVKRIAPSFGVATGLALLALRH